jgi:hypothetical protein
MEERMKRRERTRRMLYLDEIYLDVLMARVFTEEFLEIQYMVDGIVHTEHNAGYTNGRRLSQAQLVSNIASGNFAVLDPRSAG